MAPILDSDSSASNGASHGAALLAPRASLAATMLYHGLDKLRHPDQARGFFEQVGLVPANFWVRATAVAETAAGALALLGVAVRPAALAILVTQGVAIARVHANKGFPNPKGGYEFNLALMAIATALLIGGPGRYSLSRVLGRALRGSRRRRRSRPRRLFATLVQALG